MLPPNPALLIIDVQLGLDDPKYGQRNNLRTEAKKMNRAIVLPLVLSLLNCTTVRPANQPQGTTDEATIRLLEEQGRLGVLNRDTAALRRVWSEQLTVNSPSNQVLSNRGVVLALVRQGLIHYSSFERTIEQLRIDGDVAIVMGAETIQPIGNAPLAGQRVKRRFTNIWKKEAGEWRLIARHANIIPPP